MDKVVLGSGPSSCMEYSYASVYILEYEERDGVVLGCPVLLPATVHAICTE